MKLLLTSNGIANYTIEKTLRDMLAKPVEDCNFVFIPTGGNGGFTNDKTWLVNDIHNAHSMGWKNFQIMDLAVVGEWDKALWWPVIENADVILVGGGKGGYISYWMQRSGLFEALPELLKTKVYIGISGGSMFAGQGFRVSSDALKNTAEPYEFPLDFAGVPKGQVAREALGLLDAYIRPHWGRDDKVSFGKSAMRKAYDVLQKPIYLLDDQSAIRVIDGEVKVVTEGRWMLVGGTEE